MIHNIHIDVYQDGKEKKINKFDRIFDTLRYLFNLDFVKGYYVIYFYVKDEI